MGNKKIKIKKLFLIPLVIAVCLCAGIGVSFIAMPAVDAAVIEYAGTDIPQKAALNSSISLPSNVSVSYNGKDYTAKDGVVVDPDGKITAAGSLKLSQTGTYTVKYYFNEGKVKHTVKRDVSVYTSYYGFASDNGSTLVKSSLDNPLYCGKDGVIIELKQGDTFTYNKPVNLKNVGIDGLANVIEIDARLGHFDESAKNATNVYGYVSEVEAAWVRLTDCYDPNLYMEFRIGRSPDYTGSMFTGVRTSYQSCHGLGLTYHHVPREVVIDGKTYYFWNSNGDYASYGDIPNMVAKYTTGIVWEYDYAQKRVYVSANGCEKKLLSDLDEPILFTDGKFFPDWTTGEVYVSVYGDNYLTSDTARIELVSVAGEEVYSIIDGECTDTVAPAITVNAKKTTVGGIQGAVGDTVTIPEATATDVNLVGGVEVAVYRGYGTDYVSNVTVENGKFVLAEKDLYTIVYTAKDGAGNVGKETFTVSAVQGLEKRAIALTPVKPESFTAGVPVELGYTVKENLNGSVDDVNVKIIVTSENQNVEFEGAAEFTPLYKGNYRVTYVYGDGVTSYEKSFTIACKVDASVVSFDKNVVLPDTFIKGFNYSIDGAKAYDYVKGYPSEVPVTAYAVFDGGAKTKIDDINKVEITGSNTVKFIFEAAGAESLSTETVSITDVTSGGKISGASLFSGNFSANDSGESLTLTSNVKTGNNSMKFINAISARQFSFSYKISAGYDNFAKLRFTLTDYENDTIKLVVEISNNSDAAYVSVNGAAAVKIDPTKLTFATTTNTVSYAFASKKVVFGPGSFDADVDFTSGKGYLTIEMLGITGNAAITVNSVNNQKISRTISSDNFAPQIYFVDSQGEYAIGSVVKVYKAEFTDVLSGVDAATKNFVIRANDGLPVKDANGNEITNFESDKDYEILLDRITDFFAAYSVKDFAGKSANATCMISCVDTEAPTIKLNNMNEGALIRVKAGHEININFTVSDNRTSPYNITTYIHLYCNDMYGYVPNFTDINDNTKPSDGVFDAKFSIDIRGTYTAQIHCYDEAKNHAVTRITIVVE